MNLTKKYLFNFFFKHRVFIKYSILIFPVLLFVLIKKILVDLQIIEILIFIFCALNFYLVSFLILREILRITESRYIGRVTVLNIIVKLNRENPEGLIGAEVGVYRGDYSKQIIDHKFIGKKLNIKKLYLIDPWSFYEEYQKEYKAEDLKEAFKYVSERFKNYKNIEIIRADSLTATKKIENGALDFCYIDANHDYKFVLEDLRAWYPKIKKKGILFGDNYVDPYEVQEAVQEFAYEKKLLIHFSDFYEQFFLFKKQF